MLKSTGSGKLSESLAVPAGGVRALLYNYNYDIDGSEPKPEHLAFLSTRVLPIVMGKSARCWLQGSTSHTGSESYNLALSKARVNKVAAYLVSRGASSSRLSLSHVGESMASMTIAEADGERAVTLLCAPLLAAPARRDPAPPTDVPKTTSQFTIRELGGLSGGIGLLVADAIYFQIWDRKNQLTTFYQHTAAGVGKGFKAGPPISATLQGPWNYFVTTGLMGTNEFGGAARFTTAGTMWWTFNSVNFMGLPRGIKTDPNPLDISTGFTVGAGAASSIGKMVLGPTYPFSGP